ESPFPPKPPGNNGNGPIAPAPPPPEQLSMAFGRPASAGDTVLQRPPGTVPYGSEPDIEPLFWQDSADRDPWRDPGAWSRIGAAAGSASASRSASAASA